MVYQKKLIMSEKPELLNQQQVELINNYGEKILKETTTELETYLK